MHFMFIERLKYCVKKVIMINNFSKDYFRLLEVMGTRLTWWVNGILDMRDGLVCLA